MRSRPAPRLYLVPQSPHAGEKLRARLELESRSETPYEAIDVLFIGRESRYKRTVSNGKTTTRTYHRREVVRLGARFEAGVLKPGVFTREVEIALPSELPPSYSSGLASIKYELSIRVWIPWWPDLEETYPVVVRPVPRQLRAHEPRVFTTQVGEHRGDDPVLELSLEDDQLCGGAALAGSVALTGLGGRRIRRVEISSVATETALVSSSAGPHEADRRTWVLREGTPGDGEAIPFKLKLPDDLVPTFASPFIRVDHSLEARAVVAFGRDIALNVPVVVVRPAALERPTGAEPPPLVGRDRHVAVWKAAVDHARTLGVEGLEFEPEQGRASFSVRGIQVSLSEEHREGLGPCLVASLAWEPLGVGVRVAERRWTDLGRKLKGLDEELQKRFSVQAREEAQVKGLLGSTTRDAFALFDEVGLNDGGAVVLRKGGVYQVSGLERFFALVQDLARHLSRCIDEVPPPAALASSRSAYERFAESRSVRLRAGDLSIHEWAVRGVPLALEHRFEGETPVASVLLAPAPERLESEAFRAALERATGKTAVVQEGRVGVVLPLVSDPARVETEALSFADAYAELTSGTREQPYR